MPTLKPEHLSGLLDRAKSAEIGIAVTTNNPHRLEQYLLNHAREYGEWPDIVTAIPSIPDTVFILHRSVELDP